MDFRRGELRDLPGGFRPLLHLLLRDSRSLRSRILHDSGFSAARADCAVARSLVRNFRRTDRDHGNGFHPGNVLQCGIPSPSAFSLLRIQ